MSSKWAPPIKLTYDRWCPWSPVNSIFWGFPTVFFFLKTVLLEVSHYAHLLSRGVLICLIIFITVNAWLFIPCVTTSNNFIFVAQIGLALTIGSSFSWLYLGFKLSCLVGSAMLGSKDIKIIRIHQLLRMGKEAVSYSPVWASIMQCHWVMGLRTGGRNLGWPSTMVGSSVGMISDCRSSKILAKHSQGFSTWNSNIVVVSLLKLFLSDKQVKQIKWLSI